MAQAIHKTITPDPVAEAGARIARIVRESNRREARNMAEGATGHAEDALENLRDLLESTIADALLQPARSFAGAYVQILLLSGEVESLYSYIDDKDKSEAAKYYRRIMRGIYSIETLLKVRCDLKPSDYCRDYFINPKSNPHPVLAGLF